MDENLKILKRMKRTFPLLILAVGMSILALSNRNLIKDKTLETKIKDGKTAISSNSPWSIPGLYVYNPDGSLNAFYSKEDSAVEYTDSNGVTYRITSEGYSILNHRKGNYEHFVPHCQDSSLYFKAKEYDEIMKLMKEKEAGKRFK